MNPLRRQYLHLKLRRLRRKAEALEIEIRAQTSLWIMPCGHIAGQYGVLQRQLDSVDDDIKRISQTGIEMEYFEPKSGIERIAKFRKLNLFA